MMLASQLGAAQASPLASHKLSAAPRQQHAAGRPLTFRVALPAPTAAPAAARSGSSSAGSRAVVTRAAAANGNGNGALLPWQVAMDDVQKRKDLKSIMIIGAGPIVIGQVGFIKGGGAGCQAGSNKQGGRAGRPHTRTSSWYVCVWVGVGALPGQAS
jgi:hypothetical protein